tara:strand:+ start:459 stop:1193 length:735 start_codon:yes stop_codon:yes gene_type:complete
MVEAHKSRGLTQVSAFFRRKSLHEELVEILREKILTSELPPGTRVPELKICAEFQVSRTPLREALKVLAADGLIVLLPNRGCIVAEVEVDEVKDAFEVLSHLELLIGQLVVKRATDDDLSMMMRLHTEMVDCHASDNRSEYFNLNQQVHVSMAKLADNSLLSDTYESLSHKIMRARGVANSDQLRWNDSVREHTAFIEALMARDGGALSFLLKDHCERTRVSVLEQLNTYRESSERPTKAMLDG